MTSLECSLGSFQSDSSYTSNNNLWRDDLKTEFHSLLTIFLSKLERLAIMSSAVWFVISIPTIEREKQIRYEQLSTKTVIEAYNLNVSDKPTNNFVPLKKILEDSFEELEIDDAVWYLNKSGKGYQVTFPCDLEASDSIIEYFASKRIGSSKETYIG
jgi:hypothetical protein